MHPEWTTYIHYDPLFDYLSRRYHLQAMVPDLYVAFADADQVDMLCWEAAIPFTHVVRIEPVEDPAKSGSRNEETMNGVCRAQELTLRCPRQKRSVDHTVLSVSQLIAARDYLSLIMPYSSFSVPNLKIRPPCFNVKVLVVAPADRAVDVISVVTSYLAFSSGYHAEAVMQCIDEEVHDEVWKGGISREGLDFVERIARIM